MTTGYQHYSPVLKKYAPCSNPANCRFKTSQHFLKEVVTLMDETGGIARGKMKESFDIISYSKTFDTTLIRNKKIAPEGFSSLYCDECERYQSKEQYSQVSASSTPVKCEYKDCDNKLDGNMMLVDVRHEDRKFLQESEVKKALWYHATNQTDWLRKLQETGEYNSSETVLAHVGTKEAAKERMRDILKRIYNASDSRYFVYELKLKDKVNVNPVVFSDVQDEWPERIGNMGRTPFGKNSVNRYVNEYEAAGSISLFADPNLFEVVKIIEVKA